MKDAFDCLITGLRVTKERTHKFGDKLVESFQMKMGRKKKKRMKK